MPRFLLRARPILLALCCVAAASLADPNVFAQPPGGKGGFKGKGGGKPGELKKFDEVITKDAKTTTGVFTVHRLDEKVYFEIPKEALGRLMLWTIEVARGPAGVSWGGKSLGNKVVRWERRGNRAYLWDAGFTKRANGQAVQRAVDSANGLEESNTVQRSGSTGAGCSTAPPPPTGLGLHTLTPCRLVDTRRPAGRG